jgi:DNA-binding transcriptional LysR family regulator
MELEELDASMRSNTADPRGELRVTAPISFAEIRMMSAVAEFSRRYPNVRLNLVLSDRFVDLVEERIDVAIRIGDLEDSSLVARRLGSTSMLVCASPGYLARRGEPEQPAQLAEHACVVDSNHPAGTRWKLGSGNGVVTVDVPTRILVNSARGARELVLAGQGISYLPSFAVSDDIAAGKLKRLFPGFEQKPLGIFALYPHRRHLSAKVRLFIETAVELCGDGV